MKKKERIFHIVSFQGEVATIEWEEGGLLQRGKLSTALPGLDPIQDEFRSLPLDTWSDNVTTLEYDWVKLLPYEIHVDKLADELRRAGIWTSTDFLNNPNLVVTIVRSHLMLEISDIFELLKEDSNE